MQTVSQHSTPRRDTGLGPIGLDIGARSIRAAQVRREAGGPRLHAAVRVARTRPERPVSVEEMERLARVLGRQGFEGSEVVVGLPDDKLLCNTLEQVGQGTGAPMEVVSRVELARSAGCAPPQLEAACWSLPAPARARQSTHVLAVGCLHTEANALLDAVEGVGLRAMALEPRPLALTRACGPRLGTRPGICAVVDVSWEGATNAVVYHGTLVYHRSSAELGVGGVAKSIVSGLGADDALAEHLVLGRTALAGPDEGGPRLGLRADAAQLMGEHTARLAHELGLALSYASHWYAQPQVDLVLLCGEAAAMPGLAGALATGVGTEVRTATLDGAVAAWPAMSWAAMGGAEATRGAELMTALGLALW